jgi:hypothetical protein
MAISFLSINEISDELDPLQNMLQAIYHDHEWQQRKHELNNRETHEENSETNKSRNKCMITTLS